jgi:hypothetical protein
MTEHDGGERNAVGFYDDEAAARGWSPWDADAFLAVHNAAVGARQASPPWTATLTHPDGTEERMDEVPTILHAMRILRSEYERAVALAHLQRYRRMLAFLDRYDDELRAGGWVGEDGVSYTLLRVLAGAEFTSSEFDVARDRSWWTFDYSRIVSDAEALEAASA